MAVLLANYISAFCMELCISGGSHIKYTYMIGRKHNHIMLPDHTSLSPVWPRLDEKIATNTWSEAPAQFACMHCFYCPSSLAIFKFNPTELKPLNQFNSSRQPIKTTKVWIEFDFIFYKLYGLDWILDLIFKTNLIQFKSNNIILYNFLLLNL